MDNNLENIRKDYDQAALDINAIKEDPIRQFQLWLDDAIASDKVIEPTAMTLATATREGAPSARIVLLKGLDDEGFRFYTNKKSKKGEELKENHQASLVFYWAGLERQVRIDGLCYELPDTESEAYFQKRPKGSQIGAWASPQSQVIKDKTVLNKKYAELEGEYSGKNVLPKPPHWGGYIVKPFRIEFWQGRPSRMHDRIRYTIAKIEPKEWTIERLAP